MIPANKNNKLQNFNFQSHPLSWFESLHRTRRHHPVFASVSFFRVSRVSPKPILRSGSGMQPRGGSSKRSRGTAVLSSRSHFPGTASSWKAGSKTARSGSGMQPWGGSSESSRGTAVLSPRSRFPRTTRSW